MAVLIHWVCLFALIRGMVTAITAAPVLIAAVVYRSLLAGFELGRTSWQYS